MPEHMAFEHTPTDTRSGGLSMVITLLDASTRCTQHWAWSVLRWVTVCGYTILVCSASTAALVVPVTQHSTLGDGFFLLLLLSCGTHCRATSHLLHHF